MPGGRVACPVLPKVLGPPLRSDVPACCVLCRATPLPCPDHSVVMAEIRKEQADAREAAHHLAETQTAVLRDIRARHWEAVDHAKHARVNQRVLRSMRKQRMERDRQFATALGRQVGAGVGAGFMHTPHSRPCCGAALMLLVESLCVRCFEWTGSLHWLLACVRESLACSPYSSSSNRTKR